MLCYVVSEESEKLYGEKALQTLCFTWKVENSRLSCGLPRNIFLLVFDTTLVASNIIRSDAR